MAMARPEVTDKKPHATAHASDEARPIRGLAMSIREFCTAHSISEDMFFKMRRQTVTHKRPLFFCAYGERSAMAVQAAQDSGLHAAFHIQGGLDAWKTAGGPVERLAPAPI
jgi:rhodanese-related sulfurtransferase